jgi:hypothetical protein
MIDAYCNTIYSVSKDIANKKIVIPIAIPNKTKKQNLLIFNFIKNTPFKSMIDILSYIFYLSNLHKKQRKLILENAQGIKVKTNYSNSKKETLDNWLKNNMKY